MDYILHHQTEACGLHITVSLPRAPSCCAEELKTRMVRAIQSQDQTTESVP